MSDTTIPVDGLRDFVAPPPKKGPRWLLERLHWVFAISLVVVLETRRMAATGDHEGLEWLDQIRQMAEMASKALTCAAVGSACAAERDEFVSETIGEDVPEKPLDQLVWVAEQATIALASCIDGTYRPGREARRFLPALRRSIKTALKAVPPDVLLVANDRLKASETARKAVAENTTVPFDPGKWNKH